MDSPVDELPPYTAHAAESFDDSLAPPIFGVQHSQGRSDIPPPELIRSADYVGLVRLTTITRLRGGVRTRYRIVLQPLENFAGTDPESPLEVTVGLASPSVGLLRSFDTEAVGRKFIILLKRYRANGEAVWHFRGFAETDDALAAIRAVQ